MEILDDLTIPDEELSFVTSRSSGPGGQNVNKVSTRVTVLLDVASSPSLSAEQKQRLMERAGGRIDSRGILRVSSQSHRTQLANRRAAVARLVELMRDALTERPARAKARIPAVAHRRRLEEKRRRSILKRRRAVRQGVDE